MPVASQTSDPAGTSPTRVASAAAAPGCDRAAARASRSSTRVFHSPQVGQRPSHFGATAPHSAQTSRTRAGRAAGGGADMGGA